jgi:hypothetical protein
LEAQCASEDPEKETSDTGSVELVLESVEDAEGRNNDFGRLHELLSGQYVLNMITDEILQQ